MTYPELTRGEVPTLQLKQWQLDRFNETNSLVKSFFEVVEMVISKYKENFQKVLFLIYKTDLS